MPLTDSYGQNITYPTLTDKPNAQTLGQGIVEGLTPKSVMRFASAVVRGATITSPTEGMVTWLQDVNRLEVFDGSAWVVVAAGTSIWTTVSLVSGFTHNGNDNGTFQYRVVNLFGEPTLMLRGAVDVTYSPGIPNGGILNSVKLPTSARPATKRSILVPCSDTGSTRIALKLDIETDGDLNINGTNSTDIRPGWIGFNGVFCSL